MKTDFSYIDINTALKVLGSISDKEVLKQGVNSATYYYEDYAILKTTNMNYRNVSVEDFDLKHFDDVISRLMELKKQAVNVVPILGYQYDGESEEKDGLIIQEKAKGEELYDDSIIMEFYVFAQNGESDLEIRKSAKEYILKRTKYVSEIKQEHFNKFIADAMVILEQNLLIDFFGKSNFYYDEETGFQFIDIKSHDDYYYGLTEEKLNINQIISLFGFMPCHLDESSGFLGHMGLSHKAITEVFTQEEQAELSKHNNSIFENCKKAMVTSGISAETINESLSKIKLF